MNNKKAKQLRKQAKYNTQAERKYKGTPPQFAPITDQSTGAVLGIRKVASGVPAECTNSEYKTYKQLKKEYK